MREEHGVVLAGGQESLSGKIFRIGHMGYCTAEEIQQVLDALAVVLPLVGFSSLGVEVKGP
jgi:aspartate aminotransferase-like enzyme